MESARVEADEQRKIRVGKNIGKKRISLKLEMELQ
jgi:hypothetical protein